MEILPGPTPQKQLDDELFNSKVRLSKPFETFDQEWG